MYKKEFNTIHHQAQSTACLFELDPNRYRGRIDEAELGFSRVYPKINTNRKNENQQNLLLTSRSN
jgi:hypothetical protein